MLTSCRSFLKASASHLPDTAPACKGRRSQRSLCRYVAACDGLPKRGCAGRHPALPQTVVQRTGRLPISVETQFVQPKCAIAITKLPTRRNAATPGWLRQRQQEQHTAAACSSLNVLAHLISCAFGLNRSQEEVAPWLFPPQSNLGQACSCSTSSLVCLALNHGRRGAERNLCFRRPPGHSGGACLLCRPGHGRAW